MRVLEVVAIAVIGTEGLGATDYGRLAQPGPTPEVAFDQARDARPKTAPASHCPPIPSTSAWKTPAS